MSYATLLSEEGIKSQFLVVIKPRFRLESFTLISGTKYSKAFTLGQIISVSVDGSLITEATSSALSDGDWFYDVETELFYLDIGSNPTSSFIVCTYEIYLGTFDAHWYRIPDDNTSREVYYEPLIKKSPSINLTVSDGLFGFMPSQSSSLQISNATHLLQEHIYASSFKNCDIDLWHWLDELSIPNLNLIFKGICGNIQMTDSDISISVIDRNQIFKNEYRHAVGESFFGSTAFPNCEPNSLNRPIRKVFGYIEKMVPTNIDYVSSNPTTSDNRTWIVTNDETNLGSVSSTVPASPVSTTTRTYLSSVNGFRVGDSVWIDSSAGSGFDGFVYITAVGANYIDHAAIGTAAASASVVKRSFVGNVKIFSNGVLYDAIYGRDYAEYTDATNRVAGFAFDTALETNLSMPSTLSTFDLVFCRAYGHKVTSTLGGNPFGSNSTETGSLTNGIVILYDILKSHLGLAESEIDLTEFTNLEGTVIDEIGFVVPQSKTNDFPSYSDLIVKIATTLLLKVFQNTDNEWSISQIAPIIGGGLTIEDDEILKTTFKHSFEYEDILSDIIVTFKKQEVSNDNQVSNDSFSRKTATSDVAKFLHQVRKQKTFESFLFLDAEATVLANRLSYIFGERKGTISLSTKNRFFNSLIGDEITVNRTRQSGFSYDIDLDRARDTSIISIQKSLNNITLELSDQKGIEDNSGVW